LCFILFGQELLFPTSKKGEMKMEMINIGVLAPFIVVSLLLVLIAVIDLIRRPQTNGPKWIWALVILFISTLGPIIYFIFGRKES